MKLKVVADANILISALIRRGLTLDLLFSNKLEIIIPEYLLAEVDKHLKEISEKSGLSKLEIAMTLILIQSQIEIIPREEFQHNLAKACKISPDVKDTPYLALALTQKTPIWSNDKKLKNQNKVKVLSTKEIMQKITPKR
jgi:putative PIN family toxin of toxin-antitoxin system